MMYFADALMLITMLGALFLGFGRSWKVSFSNAVAHFLSLGVTWFMTVVLAPPIVEIVFRNLNLSDLLPANIGFWIGPFERGIIHTAVFSLVFIGLFITSKSIFHGFSWTYEWTFFLFRWIKLPRFLDGILSALFTGAHAATWIWAVLLVAAFPLFTRSGAKTLTGTFLGLPLIQEQARTLYEPMEGLQTVLSLMESDIIYLLEDGRLNQDFLGTLEREQARELKYHLVESLPYLPDEFSTPIYDLLGEMME